MNDQTNSVGIAYTSSEVVGIRQRKCSEITNRVS